ncbi:MAG: hypothetical protein SFV55_06175 [Haliscomenobacter sp.]|uniref:hypothetical protein n=1 Tax=Haliscomenobacter sp. TaxID=2717303 RepID=UPI0029B8120C|nr:hypothetical protein [Haliscomenobacter sp.]MDX2067993.1 hypothetical protein [Haliscomenobacter sp.]
MIQLAFGQDNDLRSIKDTAKTGIQATNHSRSIPKNTPFITPAAPLTSNHAPRSCDDPKFEENSPLKLYLHETQESFFV